MTNEAEGLDLDALEKVARGVASIGSWRCGPNMLNGGLTVNDAVGSIADILSDGPGEYIATFDPPTVLRLLAALRAQAERVRVLEGERDEARRAAGWGCDADGGGAHDGFTQPNGYTFCLKCGETLPKVRASERFQQALARAEAAERRAGEAESVVSALVNAWPETSVPPGPLCVRAAAVINASALLPATQAEGVERPAPEPPWPAGAGTNCKREGWAAFFAGRGREDCPFPPGRSDLQRGYREGWDAAAATQAEGEK